MSYRVLIMEDDFDLMTQWSQAFAEAGVDVGESRNQEEAEALLNAEKFDALVTDIYIKNEDGRVEGQGGIMLVAHVRTSLLGFTPKWAKSIPIVAITATPKAHVIPGTEAQTFDPLTFIADKVDITLRKPIDPRELVRLVIELIEARSNENAVSS